eukprot:PhF_6_TR17029/c1_g1_i2/m.25858
MFVPPSFSCQFDHADVRQALTYAISNHCSFVDFVGLEISSIDTECILHILRHVPASRCLKSFVLQGTDISPYNKQKLERAISREVERRVKTPKWGEEHRVERDAMAISEHTARQAIIRSEIEDRKHMEEVLETQYAAAVRWDLRHGYAQRVLFSVQNMIQLCVTEREAIGKEAFAMYFTFVTQFENSVRQDIVLLEGVTRKGVQRQGFRSFEVHKGSEMARLRQEYQVRVDFGDDEQQHRASIASLEQRCWKVLMDCSNEYRQQIIQMNAILMHQAEEDKKRMVGRANDLEMRREMRHDRAVKDEAKMQAVRQVERDQLARLETKVRAKLEDMEEPALRNYVHDLYLIQTPIAVKMSNIGNALRSREVILNEPTQVTIQRPDTVLCFFSCKGYKFQIGAGIEVHSKMHWNWGKQVESAGNLIKSTLHEFAALRNYEAGKEKELMKHIVNAAKTSGIHVDCRTILTPTETRVAKKTLLTAQTIPLRTIEECTRRKNVIWGGSITVHYNCVNLVKPTLSVTSDLVRPEERDGKFVIPLLPDGTITLAYVTKLLQTLTIEIDQTIVTDSNPLPVVGDIEINVVLTFANLIDAVDEIPLPSVCYNAQQKLSIPFLLCEPFIVQYFTGIHTWEEGYPESNPFGTLSVTLPPSVRSAPHLTPPYLAQMRVLPKGAFDGGQLTIRFSSGYTPDDKILFASGSGTSIQSGVIKVGDEVLGELAAGFLPRVKDVLTSGTAKVCQTITIKFKGGGATPQNVEAFVRCLRFYNTSKDPVLGPRVVTLEIQDSTFAKCFATAKVEIMPKDHPTTLIFPTTRLLYHSVCMGNDLPESMVRFIEPHELPLAIDASVVDPDTDQFVGGHLIVKIATGLLRGDDLYVVPSLPGNEHLMEGETPEPVGIVLEAGNRVSYYGICFGTVTWTVNESKDPIVVKKKKPKKSVAAVPEALLTPTLSPTSTATGFDGAQASTLNLSFVQDMAVKEESTINLTVGDYDANVPVVYSEVRFEFDTDGSARIPGVHELLRCMHYRNRSLIPKPGERTIEIEIEIGPTYEKPNTDGLRIKELLHKNELMKATVNLRVTQPLFKLATKSSVVRYMEGSGPKRFIPIEVLNVDETGVESYNGGSIRVEIVDGSNDEDSLWIREEGGVEISSVANDCEAAPLLRKRSATGAFRNNPTAPTQGGTPPAIVTPPSTPRDTPTTALSPRFLLPKTDDQMFREHLTAKLEDIVNARAQRRARWNAAFGDFLQEAKKISAQSKIIPVKSCDILWNKSVVGVVSATGRNLLEIVFNRGGNVLGRKEITAIIRAITYCNSSQNPQALEKRVKITVKDSSVTYSQGLMVVQIQRFDDPPEFRIQNDKMVYRQGANELEETCAGAYPLVPMDQGYVFDPDTTYFDGGTLSVENVAGACRGDNLYFLTVLQQRAQYQKLKRPPAHILSITEGNKLTTIDGIIIGEVEYPKNTFMQTSDIVIRFHEHSPKMVSIDMVSFVLNSIGFATTSDRVREGMRIYRATVTDGVNTLNGKVTLQVDVQSALMYLPNFAATVNYGGGNADPIPLIPRVMCMTEKSSVVMTTGFVDIRVRNPDEWDQLLFIPPAATRTVPTLQIIGNSLVEGGVFVGRITANTRTQISVSLNWASKMTYRHLESFLRSIYYSRLQHDVSMTSSTSTSPPSRTIVFTVNDGSPCPNVITSTVQLNGVAKPGK